jgi:hypothetical protein
MAYRVRGSYFESCNCEAICPCRMVGGVVVDDEPFAWELSGNCASASDFDYASG